MEDKKFNQYHEECFLEIPSNVLAKAIELLKKYIDEDDKIFLIDVYSKEPEETKSQWFIPYHTLGGGMHIRNHLRQNGLADDQLPSGNWDDYYTQCLECAIGVRCVSPPLCEYDCHYANITVSDRGHQYCTLIGYETEQIKECNSYTSE